MKQVYIFKGDPQTGKSILAYHLNPKKVAVIDDFSNKHPKLLKKLLTDYPVIVIITNNYQSQYKEIKDFLNKITDEDYLITICSFEKEI